MFADINLAASQAARAMHAPAPVTIANLDVNVGLPRIRRYASVITAQLKEAGVTVDHVTGGLDEYPMTGEKVARIIKEKYSNYDYVVLTGVPHAVPYEALKDMEVFSVTNGPRQVEPLRIAGHRHVMVEVDLHPKTLGVHGMVESEFGLTLRSML